jgi:hypothetical protein
MNKQALIFSWLLALALPLGADAASVLAVDLNPSTQVPSPYLGADEIMLITNGMTGWTFQLAQPAMVTGQLTEPATVTGVAWYAQNPAGFSHAHEVGLWQLVGGPTNWSFSSTNNILLFSLTIPAGTNATLLEGAWRKVDLPAPVALPGGFYVLAGTHYSQNPDVVKFVRAGILNEILPMDPRITLVAPAFTDSGTFYSQQPYDPNAPLFRIPDDGLVAPEFDFGPNLLILPPIPSLQVRASGNQIVLSWPLWATNYVLQTSGAIGPAVSWTATTNAAAVSGQNLVATNLMSTPSAFYRLRQR